MEPETETAISMLFEAQVRRAPDTPAAVFRDEQLSYRELDARANRLAHYLIKLGVGPEVLVGICVERGLEALTAILAVWKAGGAYLPLDPDYPRQRLGFMLTDARVSVLISQQRLGERIESLEMGAARPAIVFLDGDWPTISAESGLAPRVATSLQNLAYVIYTSGSTGEPKGVQIELGGLCNMAAAQLEAFAMAPGDRVLQFSSLSFDASIFEIVMALRAGATLVIVPPEARLPGPDLTRFLRAQEITLVTLPPSVLAAMPCEELPALEIITVAGEACAAELVQRWSRDRRFFNLYGPTEATVWASFAECSGTGQKPPIGRAIANTELRLLDEDLQPVAPGEPGEIFITGAGLARGYLNRPELNTERFIVDAAGTRLYRTGDIGRLLVDANIEFIGRRDDQIKLRGFRIELGEVEATLRSHPGVRDAVVNLMPGAGGEQQLVAHYVPCDPGIPDQGTELRDHMEQALPQFMVPAAFVAMQSLPLTIQGKVDRRALPPPDTVRARPDRGRAPADELEQSLAGIWEDVLGLDQLGVRESFLELGGHSLLASRAVTRIRELLEIDLSLADFYAARDIAGLAARVRQIGPASPKRDAPVFYPRARPDQIPFSYPQEQIIFLNQLAPGSIAYNAQFAIRFGGKLDVPALERSLNEILRRHEIYRSCVSMNDGRPFQKILPRPDVCLTSIDLREVAPERLDLRVGELISEFMDQRFDLARAPLVRWRLLQLHRDEYLLIHVEHHLVHDGWSFGVFINELQTLYEAYSNARESPLPELPLQFADYAIWQRNDLQGDKMQSLVDYWKQKLAGPLPVLQLPTDFLRPAQQSHRGAELVVDIPGALADRLRDLSQRNNSTLYVTMLTMFFVLLHKYSGQQDIIVGTGVANRNRSEFEGLIGMIINAIALRADLSGDPRLSGLLARLHETTFEAFTYQELPFEKLVEELHCERDLSCNPVFQALFGFHDAQVPRLRFADLEGKIEYLHNGSSKLDLNLVVIPWAEQRTGIDTQKPERHITMKWEYATDLFTSASIENMARHYRNLLQALVDQPQQRLSELSMLSAAERGRILKNRNRTAADFPADKTVPELFESCVEANPDAVAVIYDGEALSYGQLNRRANRLAHYLREQGVGPEITVGLYLQRGLDMIVAILGILKAGGAYVPLDLEYPESRLEFMLEDCGALLLLTASSLCDELPEFAGKRVCLDSDRDLIEGFGSQNPLTLARAENLAYVIYTSGSTGIPKGVEIQHRAIVRLVRNTNYYQVDATDRIAQASNISFDAATFELWGALLNGASLVGIDKNSFLDPESLAAFLRQNSISAMFVTTAVFNQVARTAPAAFRGLRCLMFGGEAVDPSSVRQVLANGPPARLLHVYGPTESTTFASWYPVAAVAAGDITVPIGRPLANTTLYVLDGQMQPVPEGVPGELYIGGEGLARGYLNQPELTAQKFVPHPFSDEAGARLYRTGDRVRLRSDGAIEFQGRFDHQIKLRGYRIELGEIESVLGRHETVREIVAVLREDRPGDKRLVAYVVAEDGAVPTAANLRAYLRGFVPGYMVPAAFMVLDSLPMTANGKLDREALPMPDVAGVSPGSGYAPPRNELERELARIWAEILGLERVGIRDNFFDLGGHSLRATQVVSRVRDRIRIEISVAELFMSSNLEAFAEKVATIRWANEKLPVEEQNARREFRL